MQRNALPLLLLLSLLVVMESCQPSTTSVRPTSRSLRFRDSAQFAPREQRELYTRAVVRVTLRDYQGALSLLNSITNADEAAAIAFLRAKCYQATARLDSALYHAALACELDSLREEHWILHAELFLSRQNFVDAARCYTRAYELHPTVSNKFYVAKSTEHVNPSQAAILLEEIYEQSSDVNMLFELSNLYDRLQMKSEYLHTMERIMNAFPAKSLPFQNYFESLIQAKDFSRALDLLEREDRTMTTESKRDNIMRLGIAVYEDSTFVDTTIIRRMSVQIDKELSINQDILEVCGMIWARLGTESTALSFLRRASALDTSGTSAVHMASFLYQQKQASLALAILQSDSSLLRTSARVNFYAGVIYALQDSSLKALSFLERAFELDTNDAEISFQLGFVNDKLGHTIASERFYEHTLTLNPQHSTTLNNLAYSYATHDKELQRASLYAERAIQLDSLNPSFLDTYGWVLYKNSQYERAEHYLRLATERNNTSATLFEHVGDNYAKLGKRDRAVEAWKRAFELDQSKTYLRERLLNSK